MKIRVPFPVLILYRHDAIFDSLFSLVPGSRRATETETTLNVKVAAFNSISVIFHPFKTPKMNKDEEEPMEEGDTNENSVKSDVNTPKN